MGKKYYCDYCDRSFKDTTDCRKKHLSSLQHVNNRMNYYRQYKDPQIILNEESAKIPCKKFLTNSCIFGESCKFSHYTPQMLMELQYIIASREQSERVTSMPSLNESLQEIIQNSNESEAMQKIEYPQWSYPQDLLNQSTLPLSLWPINKTSITSSNFSYWGE